MPLEQVPFGTNDFAVNPEPRLPCVLLLDPKGIVRYQGHPAAINQKKLQGILAKTQE